MRAIQAYYLAKLGYKVTFMELGKPGASGRRRPVPIKGSDFTVEFDNIIAAIGQQPDIPPNLG